MLDVVLTYPTDEGTREIAVSGEQLALGRGSEADVRFDDDGLSRLHATVYREGDKVWIVDENSSNGTFVNGVRVPPSGTPLNNGDTLKIGHRTSLRLRVLVPEVSPSFEEPAFQEESTSINATSSVPSSRPVSLVPIAVIAFALLFVSTSAVFIGFKVLGNSKNTVVKIDPEETTYERPTADREPTPRPVSTQTNSKTVDLPTGNTALPAPQNGDRPPLTLPAGKAYLDVSDSERRSYLRDRAMRIAEVIGNSSSDEIPDAAVDKIKSFTDAYAKRLNVKPLGGCRFGDNLQVTYERASKNAPFIVKAFNEKGIDPRIGLYLAMIESEHCVCLQSPTGPLGMFQFTKSTGEMHGLKTIRGATPQNPDERCEPEPSARAAASYMKALTGRYGTGPASVPLAIGSYNSGEGGLSSNLVKALESNSGLPRDFWTLISKGDILSKQFQSENFKYVPKFFAAAIVGEYPQDFGLKLQPLSTYSR
jgi:hypothetical protein